MLASPINVADRSLAALPTRDAVLPVIAILALAGGRPISALTAGLPKRFTASDRVQQFARQSSQQLIDEGAQAPALLLQRMGLCDKSVSAVDLTDGLRLTCTDDDVVHLRPSGNAPELRCYAESDSAVKAEFLVSNSISGLTKLINTGF